MRSYLDSPEHVAEVELLGLHQGGPPMRVRDLPVPAAEVRGWAEYLEPAGFREGLAVRLVTTDGRYLGLLGLNTDTVEHPTESARDLLGALSRTIAHAIDPLRSITAAAQLVARGVAGVMLTRTGGTLPLPGMPSHPLLAHGSRVLAAAARQLAGAARASFLCPDPDSAAPAGHVRVTVLACRPQAPAHVVSVVVVAKPGEVGGLTRRELEILGLLVEGWPNRRIARALHVTESTVATHVEHILTKLDAQTRTHAAVQAVRLGLYTPRGLHRA